MTIVEDTLTELIGEFAETITGYPHDGYSGSTSDDFWQDDDGWDKTSPYTFQGIPQQLKQVDNNLGEGFLDQADHTLITESPTPVVGDLIEYGSRQYIVVERRRRRMQGREYMYRLILENIEE